MPGKEGEIIRDLRLVRRALREDGVPVPDLLPELAYIDDDKAE